MGGGPSKADKAELGQLEQQKREKEAAQTKELSDMKTKQKEQKDRMNTELDNKNKQLTELRNSIIESNRKHEEELREAHIKQEKRAADLEAERRKELAAVQNSSDADKKKVADQFEKRAAELNKQHSDEIKRAMAEREDDKKRRDDEIRKAEEERDEVRKRNFESAKQYRKDLDDMTVKHRKEINDEYDRMHKMMEDATQARIEHIANETQKRLEIVDANHAKMKEDTINTVYNNFFKEYLAVLNRGKKLDYAIDQMAVVMEESKEEFPYELRGMHSDYITESVLMDKQWNNCRQRMQTSLDISNDFKETLISPLKQFEDSCKNVQSNSMRITLAQQRNDVKALEPLRKSFLEHKAILNGAIEKMEAIDYTEHVKIALANVSQKSITEN